MRRPPPSRREQPRTAPYGGSSADTRWTPVGGTICAGAQADGFTDCDRPGTVAVGSWAHSDGTVMYCPEHARDLGAATAAAGYRMDGTDIEGFEEMS
jgi:hypothetical protein